MGRYLSACKVKSKESVRSTMILTFFYAKKDSPDYPSELIKKVGFIMLVQKPRLI